MGRQRRGQLVGAVALAAGRFDRHLGKRLALLIEIPGTRQAHHPGRIAAAPVALGRLDQLPLQRRPQRRSQWLAQHPVAVQRAPASGHQQGGLRQAQLPPGFPLPGERPVVPLHKQRPAAVDGAVAIAAVVDHHIDAAALPLPALGLPQIKTPLAGADGRPARVAAMGEGPQAGGGRVLAQQLQKATGRLPVEGAGGGGGFHLRPLRWWRNGRGGRVGGGHRATPAGAA